MSTVQSFKIHGDGCYSFVRRKLSPEKELLLVDMANQEKTLLGFFKRLNPPGNCGLSDTQINKLINDWCDKHHNLSRHEFGYQLALYMTTYKRDNLNISELERA